VFAFVRIRIRIKVEPKSRMEFQKFLFSILKSPKIKILYFEFKALGSNTKFFYFEKT
jgi:hypothetical protein